MARAGRIEIEFAANIARLQQDIGKATGMLEGFARTARNMAGALGAGLSIAGLASIVKNAAEATFELNKMAQSIGMTAQQLSKYNYIAQMAGLNAEEFAKGIRMMDRNMFTAAQSGGKAFEAFRTLGISVKDATGHLKPNDQILGELADKFSTMPDGTMKTALAMQVFGRAGADMIPVLNMGREGLAAWTAEAERIKGALSDETIQRATAFHQILVRMSAWSEAGKKQLFAGMAEDLIRISDAFSLVVEKGTLWENAGKVIGFVLKGLAGSFTALAFAAEYSITVVTNLIDGFKTKWDQMADVVNNSGIKKAVEDVFGIKFDLPQFNAARVGLDVMNERLEKIKEKYREIARTIDLFGQRKVTLPPVPKGGAGDIPAVPVPDKIIKEWEAAQQRLEKIQNGMAADLDRFAPGLDEWEKKIVDITKSYANMESETDKLRKHFAAYPEYVAEIDKVAKAIPMVRNEVIRLIRAEQDLAVARRDTNNAYIQAQHILELNRYRLTGSEQTSAEVRNLEEKKKALQGILDSMPADSRRNAYGVALKDEIDATGRMIDLIRQRNKVETDGLEGTIAALSKYRTEVENLGVQMGDLVVSNIRRMEDAFVEFVMTGKTSFSDLIKSIEADLLRLVVRQAITGPLSNALSSALGGFGGGGGWGGGFSSLFNSLQSQFDIASLGGNDAVLAMLHNGGIVGQSGTPRSLPASILSRAPRLHGGLAADEVPAILQKGETVIPRGQGRAQSITMNVYGVTDPGSFKASEGQIMRRMSRAVRRVNS